MWSWQPVLCLVEDREGEDQVRRLAARTNSLRS